MIRSRSRISATVVLLALLAGGVGACATEEPAATVTVMGPWTGDEPGDEGYAFRQVLRRFTETTGIPVNYQETRALTQVLRSNVQAGTPPDVAFSSSPSDLARYARDGQLYPLDGAVGKARQRAFPRSWLLPQEIGGETHPYAVPVKTNLKSMIWHNKSVPALTAATSWEDLLARSRDTAANGVVPWCMGLGDGPSSGWPATDFIENVLLSVFGADRYREWAAGRLSWQSIEVAGAWKAWGAIATDANLVRGGPEGAILTDFGDAGRSMFADRPECVMHQQASFIMGFYQSYEDKPTPGTDFDFIPFPNSTGEPTPPVIASSDFAGMFNDTPQARELMEFLAGEEAQSIWPAIPGSGAFAMNKHVDPAVYKDEVSAEIAKTIRQAPDLCFDAADLMPSTMRNAFYRAALDYLADPAQLPSLLRQLDRVRVAIPEENWLDHQCRR